MTFEESFGVFVCAGLSFVVALDALYFRRRETVETFAWALVYLARALDFVKRCWGSVLFESRIRDCFSRSIESKIPFDVRVLRPLGRVLFAPVAWMYPAAVSLTIFANRFLPPLPPDAGFLARLYPRPGDW